MIINCGVNLWGLTFSKDSHIKSTQGQTNLDHNHIITFRWVSMHQNYLRPLMKYELIAY